MHILVIIFQIRILFSERRRRVRKACHLALDEWRSCCYSFNRNEQSANIECKFDCVIRWIDKAWNGSFEFHQRKVNIRYVCISIRSVFGYLMKLLILDTILHWKINIGKAWKWKIIGVRWSHKETNKLYIINVFILYFIYQRIKSIYIFIYYIMISLIKQK